MNIEFLGAFIIGVGSLGLLQSLAGMWRHATPREPNPEPGPTDAEGTAWGEKFEAMRKRTTPHTLKMEGWREQRRAKEFEMEIMDQAIADIEAEDEERGAPYTLADAYKRARAKRAREISELDQVLAEDERANQ